MIDGIRSTCVPVPSLDAGRAWYGIALQAQPYLADPEAVTFYLNGFLLTLRQGPAQAAGTVVYWSVDHLEAELERLQALGAQPHEPVSALDEFTRCATLLDPFGNVLGLVERDDPAERQARSRRSAERIALREIRTVLDDLGADEQKARKLQRLLWSVLGAGVVVGGLALWLFMPERPPRGQDLLDQQPAGLRRP
jgi:hypothetical protein